MIRPPKINVITEADYRSFHWPRIREAVAAALLGPWNVTFSSEELYRHVLTRTEVALILADPCTTSARNAIPLSSTTTWSKWCPFTFRRNQLG